MAAVRIGRENPHGGWNGTNLKTKKAVRIKSARCLRGKAANWPGDPKTKDTDGVAETVAAVTKGHMTKGVTVSTGPKKSPKSGKGPARRRNATRANVAARGPRQPRRGPSAPVAWTLRRRCWPTPTSP